MFIKETAEFANDSFIQRKLKNAIKAKCIWKNFANNVLALYLNIKVHSFNHLFLLVSRLYNEIFEAIVENNRECDLS